MGEFNEWKPDSHPLRLRGESGLFEGFVAGLGPGAVYKYHVVSRLDGYEVDKADPFAFRHETPPRTGSVVWDLDYAWGDREWMGGKGRAPDALRPGLDLRGAPRLLAPRPRPARPLPHATASWHPRSPTTSRRWASPTSSSCR